MIPLLLLGSFACHADVYSHMGSVAEQFIRDRLTVDPADRVEITTASIDSRRPLHDCENGLEVELAGSENIRRTNSVHLSCAQPPVWDIFVPVRVRILKPYVTVAAPVARGTVLDPALLTLDFMDETLQRGDTFDQVAPLVGVRSKRDLRPGEPVRQHLICVVCRGDIVEIVAQIGGLSIKTEGRALQDASFGDRVRVENLRSKRIISATVEAAGHVKVAM